MSDCAEIAFKLLLTSCWVSCFLWFWYNNFTALQEAHEYFTLNLVRSCRLLFLIYISGLFPLINNTVLQSEWARLCVKSAHQKKGLPFKSNFAMQMVEEMPALALNRRQCAGILGSGNWITRLTLRWAWIKQLWLSADELRHCMLLIYTWQHF